VTALECLFAGAVFLETDADKLLHSPGAPEHLRDALRRGDTDLEPEYVRLFLSPAGAPCPPWQSAHEAERKLMGDAHRSAQAWYARYDAAPRRQFEPADHAGLLLMFYAQLLAAHAPHEELAAFYERHISWIAGLGQSVAVHARPGFYREFGAWLAGLVSGPPDVQP
jgi:TorA maturation chaperone TorD